MLTSILPGGRAKEHETLAKRLAQGQQQIERDVSAKQRELEHARDRATHLRASCDAAYGVCSSLEADIRELNRVFDGERSDLERQLTQLADPRIDEFITWLDQENAGLIHKRREYEGLGPPTVSSAHRRTIRGSNHDAIVVIAMAIVEARRGALTLKLQHVPDVQKALDELRRSIPTIDAAEAAQKRAS